MRIAVIGAGGVGGYYAARLAAAGASVHIVARGGHLAAIQQEGLRLQGSDGHDVLVKPDNAVADPGLLDPVDLVILGIKLYDVDTVVDRLAPLLGDGGLVLTLQNGVYAHERCVEVLGGERVLGGLTYVSAAIVEPGTIRQNTSFDTLEYGPIVAGAAPKRRLEIQSLLSAAAVDAVPRDDVVRGLWEKFVGMASFAAISCLTRQPVDIIQRDAVARGLFLRAMREMVAVAEATGVTFAPDFIEQKLAFTDGYPAGMAPSTLVDLRQGRRLEMPWLSGYVAEMGRRLSIDAPIHETAAMAMQPFAAGTA